MKQLHITLLILLILVLNKGNAQKNVMTFGVDLKLITPVKFFEGDDVIEKDSVLQTNVKQVLGYNFGGSVRYGFTDQIGIEFGINYTKRNYELQMQTDTLQETDRFGVTGFEIPVKGLYFVKFNDELLMHVGAGLSFDFFLSNYNTVGDHYKQYTAISPRINYGLLVNVGFEYRLKKKGIVAIGAEFHRPFFSLGITQIRFGYTPSSPAFPYTTFSRLNGNYIAIGLKYFFEEKPLHLQKKATNEQ